MPGHNPIIIWSQSPRAGSTWMQRLVTAHGPMIWGEYSLMQPLNYFWKAPFWTSNDPSEEMPWDAANTDLRRYEQKGVNMWMAVLKPYKSDLEDATREWFLRCYWTPAARLGVPGWGAKETMWEVHQPHAFRQLFPDARFVYLYRCFTECWGSRFSPSYKIPGGEAAVKVDKRDFAQGWLDRGSCGLADRHPNTIRARYEVLTQSEDARRKLIEWLGLAYDEDAAAKLERISHSARKPLEDWDKLMLREHFNEPVRALTGEINEHCEI